MGNKLIISADIDEAYKQVIQEIGTKNVIIYDDDEFKVEKARELIAHAYLASETQKYIIVKAKKYNEVSQNALLKILEEPPRNINIFLIGISKAIFLPTIRSRLKVETIRSKQENIELEYDMSRLDLATVYRFGKSSNRFMDKEVGKAYLKALFEEYKNRCEHPDEEILNFFSSAYKLIELNSNVQSVIITLMLMVINDKKTSRLH